MIAAYRKEGAAALSHGNRGGTPHNALGEQVKERILELARTKYTGCNQQHMSELLAEQEGIQVSRSTLRNTLLPCCKGVSQVAASVERPVIAHAGSVIHRRGSYGR